MARLKAKTMTKTITAPLDLAEFVTLLRRGEPVACPTETQMGLLADALDAAAVQRVARLKGRPQGEPMGLLAPSLQVVEQLSLELSPLAHELAARHWPGPLTLVLRARGELLPAALLKDGKVAVRVPGPSPALELVRAFGGPLTATSANKSGQPPARDAEQVRAMLGPGVAVVPGPIADAAPSTLLDVTGPVPRVLRQGPVQLPF